MKRARTIATLVLGLLAMVCGFGGTTAALLVTQPAVSAHVAVQFTVNQGDTVDAVANRLQADGLIRSALAFRVLAKVHRAVFQAGTYTLYPDMTMDAIIATLEQGAPVQQVSILVPPGMRVTQYPAVFKQLANFNAKDFMTIATTGNYLDGTSVNADFWFVPPKKYPNAAYALEGYLFPDTYEFNASDDAAAVVKRLLDGFGQHICPGPDAAHADAYLASATQCKAHAIAIGGKNIFTLLEKNYATSDDRLALYDAVTLASIVMREVSKSKPDIQSVTDVYYNRYLVSAGKFPNPPSDAPSNLDADPTVQYARASANPPTGTQSTPSWWPQLSGDKHTPNTPYNTYDVVGLPPGPISAPVWTHLTDAITPDPPGPNSNFWFFATCINGVNTEKYARTQAQFTQEQAQYPNPPC
jgi:UPF0755 protein